MCLGLFKRVSNFPKSLNKWRSEPVIAKYSTINNYIADSVDSAQIHVRSF